MLSVESLGQRRPVSAGAYDVSTISREVTLTWKGSWGVRKVSEYYLENIFWTD